MDDWTEYISTNLKDNGYNRAHFRRSKDTITIVGDRTYGCLHPSKEVVVPSRLEVLTSSGWEQHAVIFRREDVNELLYMFFADGTYTSIPEHTMNRDLALYDDAQRKGLTRGRIGTDKPILDAAD